MYSAVHHGGRRLYELAREGVEVVREPREVVIHAIEVQEVAPPDVGLRVVCGKGTYLRTLAADLGAALGCGAAVRRLVRTRVGPFQLVDAVSWEALTVEEAPALWARVQPPAAALADWPAIRLDARAMSRFEHGQPVELAPARTPSGTLVRVHAGDGRLLGVGEVMEADAHAAGADASCGSSGDSSPSGLTPDRARSPSESSTASTSVIAPSSGPP